MISQVDGQTTSAASAVRHVLGNRAIRRIELAWTLGTAADWARHDRLRRELFVRGLLITLIVVADLTPSS